MSRYIAIGTDGTRNGRDDEFPTNVQMIHNALQVPGVASLYYAGPGNEDENNLIGEILGGAFGVGCWEIEDMAYEALEAVYMPGDEIVLHSFSRGCIPGRKIARRICVDGVNGHFPGVAFLGCFDTVYARLPFGKAQQTAFEDLRVHPDVRAVYHALAADEDRAAFAPNLMEPSNNIVQEVFEGNHADIGGGYEDRGRADVTLRRMLDAAFVNAGLPHAELPVAQAIGPIHREDGLWRRKDRVFPDHVLRGRV